MIVIQEDGNYFGETRVLGIGNAKPELKYGKVAKKLREDANITVEELEWTQVYQFKNYLRNFLLKQI